MRDLTIVMYHYVRPIKDSLFPNIKGLELNSFKKQLNYLNNEFNIIRAENLINCIKKNKPLPEKACWLTFDDGYKDHIQYVLPELKRKGLQGSFFPPRFSSEGKNLLEVNAIHFILEKCKNINQLRLEIDLFCLENNFNQLEIKKLWINFAKPNRFDDAITIYVKRMLQHILPKRLRKILINDLFEKYVGISQSEFCKELYMSKNDLIKLINEEMYIGSHGSSHYWLNKMDKKKQLSDINTSLSFLEEIGAKTKDWIMCYPYGAYNKNTLSILENLGALIGITTQARKANLKLDNPLELPRLDTNDFPK